MLKATSVLLVVAVLSSCGSGHAGGIAKTKAHQVTKSSSAPPPVLAGPSACTDRSELSNWGLARLVAQVVVVPVQETEIASISPSVRDGVGGVILYGSQAPSDLPEQLKALDSLSPDGIRPLAMTDEEGGEVQRMANLVGSLPWPRSMASSMSVAQVKQAATQIGRNLAANGIDMDLAPVLDTASGPGPDAEHTDGPRSFSSDPTIASNYGLAFAQGLQVGGVIPVVKHFPGEGNATANTEDAPASTPALPVLEQRDLLPFQDAVHGGIPAVMVGDATVPGLTTQPADLSSSVIQGLLEGQLGYQGLVLTDSLSADAISASGLSIQDAAVEAVKAGADLVLFNSSSPNETTSSVINALVAAAQEGTLPLARLIDAVNQVLEIKGVDLCSR